MTLFSKPNRALLSIITFSLALFSCQQSINLNPDPAPLYVAPDQTRANQVTFEVLWQEIATSYLRSDFGGTDWELVHDSYASRVEGSQSPQAFHELMEEMIAEIPNSGIKLTTRQERISETVASSPNLRSIGTFTGIRDQIGQPARLIVLHVVPGSPAAAAGLLPHETIFEINDAPIEVNKGEQSQNKLRAAEGDQIKLMVQTPLGERRVVIVNNQSASDRPRGSALEYRILPNTDILYIKFPPNENRETLNELVTAVDQLQARSSENKGLIIDLRVMTGERRSTLLQFLALLTDGSVFKRIELDGDSEEIAITGVASGLQNSDSVPMVVLVGQDTSGTGEIFSAAVQDNGRALIIGQQTPGEIEEVTGKFLPNGTQLFLPTSTLITIQSERDIGQLGVTPDILVETDWDQFRSGNDPLINLGIQTIQKRFTNQP